MGRSVAMNRETVEPEPLPRWHNPALPNGTYRPLWITDVLAIEGGDADTSPVAGYRSQRLVSALVVDGDLLSRRGLRSVLDSSGRVLVVGEADTSEAASGEVRRL